MENCNCKITKRVKKTFSRGNGFHVYLQCQNCGLAGAAQKKQTGDENLPELDVQIRQKHFQAEKLEWTRKRAENERQKRLQNRKEYKSWMGEYHEYLETEEWFNLKDRVLRRDNYLCQVCLKNRAYSVHHETYFYHNNGFENCLALISICDSCHKELHSVYKANNISLKLFR